jgi:hypothetical protein
VINLEIMRRSMEKSSLPRRKVRRVKKKLKSKRRSQRGKRNQKKRRKAVNQRMMIRQNELVSLFKNNDPKRINIHLPILNSILTFIAKLIDSKYYTYGPYQSQITWSIDCCEGNTI